MEKKMVDSITSMDEDFAQWYTDIVTKAELIDYTTVKGCVILRPNAYALWEEIQADLNKRFKETGHQNVYMPMFIPESLLKKEADHVEGFAPEVAWVTHGGYTELTERLCIRPTSETLFCEHYANIIKSYRDLPKLYNQWCSVVRWEKTTRPFLRSREFLWQEGHTIHETADEAREESLKMLNVYDDFCVETLAMPVLKGRKTDKEKFAGAEDTYSIEALMYDGKALQAGTTHYFGDSFAKAFSIQYMSRENTLQFPFQSSWGVSTRLIGAIIMLHGDSEGLVLPPKIAPTQVIIVPIMPKKEIVMETAVALKEKISKVARVAVDDTDNSPGWKYSEHEMKGVPIRLEIGPRDIENNQCVLVRRDTREKIVTPLDNVEQIITDLLVDIHNSLYNKALERTKNNTYNVYDFKELIEIAKTRPGYIKAMWCGDSKCEDKVYEEAQVYSRCVPFNEEAIGEKCVCCGEQAKHLVYWGKQY